MSDTPFAQAQARIAARRQARRAQDAAAARSASASVSQSSPLARRLAGAPGAARLAAAWDALAGWGGAGGREGTRPAFRVGQVDAELLDEELVELLRAQVGEALRYVRGGSGSGLGTGIATGTVADEWRAEILLALRAVLFKLTVWDHDATYGAALQNLRYTDARREGPVLAPPTRWQKALYGLVTVGGRYAWSKWEDWLLERDSGDSQYDNGNDNDDIRGRPRNRSVVRRLARLTSALSTAHAAAAFVSFLVFLLRGRYRTLLDRVLRMRLAPPTSQVSREVSFEYLNRQLVWHAFTEFLLFVLPLVGINRWRRWFARAWRKTKDMIANTGNADGEGEEKKGEYAFLPERTCAICYQDQNAATTASATGQDEGIVAAAAAAAVSGSGVVGSSQTDITNPYETIPCGCVYCFVCLATRIEREEGEGWTCLRCGQLVKECKPWNGDVLERPAKSKSNPSAKTVGFASDVKGLSDEDDDNYDEKGESSKVFVERPGRSVKDTSPKGSSGPSDSDSEFYEAEEDELGEDLQG